MAAPEHRTPLDAGYPTRLRSIDSPPPSISLQGGPLEADCTIAIVGTRAPSAEAFAFARDLAATLTRRGAVVVSGGARGIDAAAHQGALEAGGRTWVVAATGHGRCFPAEHAGLFERVARGPGTMLWPFAPGYAHRSAFLARNRVLACLSDVLVVVQAGERSGALHAAGCAAAIARPIWTVPAPPWSSNFEGNRELLVRGAHPLTSADIFVRALGLRGAGGTESPPPRAAVCRTRPLSSNEYRILSVMSDEPLHADIIAARADEPFQATTVVLLTLALEDVVVEGPPGFFRRGTASNP